MRALALSLLLGGCPIEPTTCDAAAEDEPSCTIGTGSVVYEPLEDGDALPVVQGAQGGFHVIGSLRLSGILPGTWGDVTDPDNPTLTFQVWTGGDLLGGYQSLARPIKVRSDGQLELVGEILVLDVGSRDEVTGRDAVLRAELADACGTVVGDERAVVLIPGS